MHIESLNSTWNQVKLSEKTFEKVFPLNLNDAQRESDNEQASNMLIKTSDHEGDF